jgi:hypothetical protein
LPDLAESDLDSDDKDSRCEDPQFESGGDEVVERDMWADHPAKQLDFEPKVESPKPASEEAPEEAEYTELGRSADRKSRWLRGKYLCSIGEKQVPPGVRQALLNRKISRK